MPIDTMVTTIFVIFVGAAILATFALFTKQSLLVAYLALGVIVGPWGLRWIDNPKLVTEAGEVGIIFLLFLLGLHMNPRNLIQMLRKMTIVGLGSSMIFFGLGFLVSRLFGFSGIESVVTGAAMMFSSTIIGLKLMPTKVLHHQHTGELMVGALLFQDIIAIFVLLALKSATAESQVWLHVGKTLVSLPLMIIMAFVCERYLLSPLLKRFESIKEYQFIVAIAWCLVLTEAGTLVGLPEEVGAFIAGIALASCPVSLFIADALQPLRDFFLVIFFFAIGATFNLGYFPRVWMPALVLAAVMLLAKPITFRCLLHRISETKKMSWEVGNRLGQSSEFSLLVAYMASSKMLVSDATSYFIQAATIITFIVSSYWVVLRYETPVTTDNRLHRE